MNLLYDRGHDVPPVVAVFRQPHSAIQSHTLAGSPLEEKSCGSTSPLERGLEGRLGLSERRAEAAGRTGQSSPAAMASSRVSLQPLDPPIPLRHIARMGQRQLGYQTTPQPLKRF